MMLPPMPQRTPGTIAVDTPPQDVLVHDPSGRHRLWKSPTRGVRTGVNLLNDMVWTVCVRVGATTYVVPPNFVSAPSGEPCGAEPPSAVIIAFPKAGRAGWRA